MSQLGFKPYTGNDPYIFLSYSHKDADRIRPIVKQLHEDGYRIWYDVHLEAGDNINVKISSRIQNATFMLCFITPNYDKSVYCRKEIAYASGVNSKQGKCRILPIYMEDFTIENTDLDFVLADIKRINAYEIDGLYHLIDQIDDITGISVCQKGNAPRQSTKKWNIEPHNILLILIALVIATPLLISGIHVKFSTKNDLLYSMETITAETFDLAELNSEIDNLVFYGCDFQLDEEFRFPYHIEEVRMYRCTNVDTLAYFSDCALQRLIVTDCGLEEINLNSKLANYLRYLDVSDNPGITDISPLQVFHNLKYLDISGTSVSELNFLSETYQSSLSYLDFSGTFVEDISNLSQCHYLTEIYGSHTNVTELLPLFSLNQIAVIEFNNCGITSLDSTLSSDSLEVISLAGNQLSNIDFIRNCPAIVGINVSGNNITDLTPLEKCLHLLIELDISHNPLDAEHLSIIINCFNIRKLCLDGIPMTQFIDLRRMHNLTHLSASGCGITDISSFEMFNSKFDFISLSNNHITDLSPLYNAIGPNNVIFDVGFNHISEIELKVSRKYQLCVIAMNPLNAEAFDGLSVIPFLDKIKGDHLVIQYYGGMNNPNWRAPKFTYYTVVDCPEDIQKKVADLFESGTVSFCDSGSELAHLLNEYGLDYSFQTE